MLGVFKHSKYSENPFIEVIDVFWRTRYFVSGGHLGGTMGSRVCTDLDELQVFGSFRLEAGTCSDAMELIKSGMFGGLVDVHRKR